MAVAPIEQQGRSFQLQSISAALACLFVVYILMPRLPKGLSRLLCVLACFPIFALVPFSTRPHTPRSLLSFMFLWVCPSKLLLRCWDIYADEPGHGFLYFVATTVMPLRIKGRTLPLGKGFTETFAYRFIGVLFLPLVQFLCFLAIVNVSPTTRSVWVSHILYCLLVYLGLEGVIGVSSQLTSLLLGVELYPIFDKPFLASSLSEFWGRRWNCLASYLLRETVYVPTLHLLTAGRYERKRKLHSSLSTMLKPSPQMNSVVINTPLAHRKPGTDVGRSNDATPEKAEQMSAICDKKSVNGQKPPLPARGVALFASFVASGLIHELIFYCITQTTATWEVTMYFTFHGVATVLEVFLRRKFALFGELPRPVAIFCTLTFVVVSAAWLFMPPVIHSGVDLLILGELQQLPGVVLNLLNRFRVWLSNLCQVL